MFQFGPTRENDFPVDPEDQGGLGVVVRVGWRIPSHLATTPHLPRAPPREDWRYERPQKLRVNTGLPGEGIQRRTAPSQSDWYQVCESCPGGMASLKKSPGAFISQARKALPASLPHAAGTVLRSDIGLSR